MSFSRLRKIPSSIIKQCTLKMSSMQNLVRLPSSICKLKGLVMLNLWACSKLESLLEELGDIEKLEKLDANFTLISQPSSSIVRLNKLKMLTFAKQKSKARVFRFRPLIALSRPCLSSLEMLNLSGNNFEHFPRSIGQLGALHYLDLSYCKRLKELPGFMGMQNLETWDLSHCNLIDGGLVEDIGCLSSLKMIAQHGTLQNLDLSDCKRLTQLPEFPQQLDTIRADWSNHLICNLLFQNISSLQNDISDSHSLSLREWIQGYRSVNLPENWYVLDNFLGFVVCYSGKLIDIRAQLIPLCVDGKLSMPQKLTLPNHSECLQESKIHFFLVPIACL
ncbi:hypothetical protein H5410_000837 [Solanum commersonii]|uniref:C-JID domain-containing protein n=1 Tax=Solanum commersonii TaxID=4109 RepID=A0A9J6AXB4_SOLCO|nr:hypothetical protein H5410_000837 [Solanum commersonii]